MAAVMRTRGWRRASGQLLPANRSLGDRDDDGDTRWLDTERLAAVAVRRRLRKYHEKYKYTATRPIMVYRFAEPYGYESQPAGGIVESSPTSRFKQERCARA